MSAELPVLQSTQWELSNLEGPPTSQLIAFINAQAQTALAESSSESSEDELVDEGSAQSSQDLFAFFSTPPHEV